MDEYKDLKAYNGNINLKKTNQNINWTPDLVQEYVKCSNDPVYFIEKYMKIINVDKGLINFKLYDYQKEMIYAYQHYRFNITTTARQAGKALPLDTKIPTPDGWKTMGDLKVNDYVFSDNGIPIKVSAVSEIFNNNDCYKIYFDDGSDVIADANHLWEVRKQGRNKKLIVKNTEQLYNEVPVFIDSRGKKVSKFSIKTSEAVNYKESKIDIDPYTLGLWLGDGSAADGRLTCMFDDLLEYKENVPYTFSDSHRKQKDHIYFGSLYKLHTDLKKYNLLKNKHIPTKYLINSIENRLELLRGLMDTDGWVEKNGQNCIGLSYTKYPQLIEDVYELLVSLGFKVFRKEYKKTNSVRFYFQCPKSKFKIFKLTRKLEKQREDIQVSSYINSRFIRKIEKVESVPTKCIVVDSENHLFLCSKHFIPTHNSTTTCGFILWYILFNTEKTVALLANKGDTAREILSKIQLAYQHLPKWLQQGIIEWNKGSFELENNSRVIAAATSADAIRGYAINLLFIDEAAFIQNWDEFFTSVYPTISSGQDTKVALVSCVTEDTYVFTENGLCQISDFIDKTKPTNPNIGYYTSKYKVLGHHKLNDGQIMVNSGKAKTNIIKTSSSSLECSTEHKLWACKNGIFNWYKSSDLTTEDYISIKYGMNIWGNNDDISDIQIKCEKSKLNLPNIITKELAYFMGLFLSEGYMRPIIDNNNKIKGGQITITCGDDISPIFDRLNFKYKKYDDLHYTISNKKLFMFLKQFGFDENLKAKNKVIPKRLLRSSKEVVCSFIKGMFDGDGCARNDGKISYTSSSEEMINQLRMLLLNLGILSQKYKNIIPPSKKVKVSSTVYTLEICSYEQCMLFYDLIGFELTRKQTRKQLLNKPLKNISKDYIPYGRTIFKDISKNGVQKNNNHINRKYCLDNNLLKEGICETNIKWEKIKSIESSENEVYDFSLNHTEDFWCHSVVYNGMLGHQTPNGLNHFYSIWVNAVEGRNSYKHIRVTWQDVPGRDEKWKQDTLAAMNFDYEKFSQEHDCSFIGSSGTLIAGWKLKELVHQPPISKKEGLIQYIKPEENNIYILICDVSRGKGLDYSAFQVLDVTKMPYQQVAVYRNNSITPVDYAEIIHRVAKGYNNASVLIEVNDIGEHVSHSLHYDLSYENVLFTENAGRSGKKLTSGFGGKGVDKGIRTTRIVKSIGCSLLKLLIEQNQLIINDFDTINELSTFSKKGNSYEAESQKHDDLVMCLVLFAWMTEQQYFKDYTNINTLMSLREKTEEDLEQDMAPFGFIFNGREEFHDEEYFEISPDSWMWEVKQDF